MQVAIKLNSDVSDAELIEATLAGDNEAFDLLVGRYQRAVYAVAFAVLSDSDAARDVLQDTFVSAYCSLSSLEDPTHFSAWLYAIARNRARGHYRSRRRRYDREIPIHAMELAQKADNCEKTDAIRQAMASLTPSQADTVMLYYMEGYSTKECAALLETSVGNIKRRLYDARQRLKKEMTDMIRKYLPEFALPRDYKVAMNTSGKVCTTKGVLEDLSEMTGVAFEAGANSSDWAVRERKLNIIAKKIPLIDIMESIANVLNCEWAKSDDETDTFRLFMDEKTQQKAEAAKKRAQERFDAEMTRRRQEFVDRLLNWHDEDPAELAKMKTENPCRYLLHTFGSGYMYQRMLKEIPGLADSLIHRKTNMPYQVMDLPKETRDLIRHVLDKRHKYNGYHGSRDGNPFPEEYDISCPEAYLWFEIVPREFIWDINQNFDLGGCGVFVRDRFFYIEDMLVEHIPSADFRAKLQILALETGKTYHELAAELAKEEEAAKFVTARDYARCWGEEDYAGDVKTDPILSKKIHVSFTGDTLADYQAAIAEAGGLSVVSDLYLARTETAVVIEEKEIDLRELLDTIADAYDYKWVKRGQLIEFQDRKWFARTSSQLPIEQVQAFRDTLCERGHFTIEEYAEIAALTNEQIEESLMPDEKLLSTGIFNWPLMRARYILRFYRTLSPDQKAALFSTQGMDARSLDKEQAALLTETYEYLDEHGDLPKITHVLSSPTQWMVLKCVTEKQPETLLTIYKFYLQTNDSEQLRLWDVRLPRLGAISKR